MPKYGNSHAPLLAASTLTLVDSVTDTEAGSQGVQSVDFSPDGTKIVSGSWSGMIKVWDSSTLTELESASAGSLPVHSVAFSPDGTKIVSGDGGWTGSAYEGTIKVWDGERRLKPVCMSKY